MKNVISFILPLLVFLFAADHTALSEESFGAERQIIDGKTLVLNGRGERTATLFSISVYEATFYNPVPVQKDSDVWSTPFPKKLEIRYVRAFSLEETREAWVYQFKESSGMPESVYADGLAQLNSWQKAIEKQDVHQFVLLENETQFFINGELKGTIPGTEFRDAFLKIFFGKNPPTKSLKKALLAGGPKTK